MALQVGAPPFSGSGGAVKVGRRIYSYPAGSQVEYSECGTRLRSSGVVAARFGIIAGPP